MHIDKRFTDLCSPDIPHSWRNGSCPCGSLHTGRDSWLTEEEMEEIWLKKQALTKPLP